MQLIFIIFFHYVTYSVFSWIISRTLSKIAALLIKYLQKINSGCYSRIFSALVYSLAFDIQYIIYTQYIIDCYNVVVFFSSQRNMQPPFLFCELLTVVSCETTSIIILMRINKARMFVPVRRTSIERVVYRYN